MATSPPKDRFCPRCGASAADARGRCPTDGAWLVEPGVRALRQWRDLAPRLGEALDGRYALVGFLGAGGMGVVYEGRDLILDRRVAIKTIRPDPPGAEPASARTEERFCREARTLARLAHPGIVTVYDFGMGEDGGFFLVMERLEGVTLAERIDALGSMPPDRALPIAVQAARAVAFANAAGVLHRDLKPLNIFLASDGVGGEIVKLLDFGLARPAEAEGASAAQYAGTPPYMAPEQFPPAPPEAAGPWTDQYALALTVYRMLAGTHPLGGADGPWAYRHRVAPPAPLPGAASSRRLAALTEVLHRALAKSPRERFPDVNAFADALLAAAAGADGPTPGASEEVTVAPSDAGEPLTPGRVVGAWRVEAPTSVEGEDAWVVENAHTGARGALRVVPLGAANGAAAVARLDALSRLGHPAVAAPLDAGLVTEDVAYVVEPLERWRSLAQGAPADRWAEPTAGVAALAQGAPADRWAELAAGVAALHAAGIVHGAISPAAVRVRPDGGLRLVGAEVAAARGRAERAGDDARALGRLALAHAGSLTPPQRAGLSALVAGEAPDATALTAALSGDGADASPPASMRIATYVLVAFDDGDEASTADALRAGRERARWEAALASVADAIERWPDGSLAFVVGLDPAREPAQLPRLVALTTAAGEGTGRAAVLTRRLRVERRPGRLRVGGQALRLATTLLSRAGPGEIVLDGASWRLLGAPPARTDRVVGGGRGERVRILPAHGEVAIAASPEAPLLARDAQVAQLLDVVERCGTGGRATAAFVVGPAGVGKTRLLEAVQARLETMRGAPQVLEATALPDERSHGLLRRLLGDVAPLAIDGGDAPEAVRDDLCLAGQLLGQPWAAERRARFAHLDARSLERRQRTAVLRLVGAMAARRPLLLVVDAFADADAASAALLRELLVDARTRPVCLLAAASDAAAAAGEAAELARRGLEPVTVHLGPLPPDAAQRLCLALMPELDARPDLRRALEQRAEGNPRFLAGLIEDLRERGLPDPGASWDPERLLALPATLEKVVERRLLALPDARVACAAAACSPTGLAAPTYVAAMLGGTPTQALAALERLVWPAGLLVATSEPFLPDLDEPAFAFASDALRRAALALLVPDERLQWATSGERCLGAAAPSAEAATLRGWFAEQAGRTAAAAEAYADAAARHGDEGRPAEAIRLLRLALSLGEAGDEVTAARRERLADHLLALGRYPEAGEALDPLVAASDGDARLRRALKAARAWGFARDNARCRAALEIGRAQPSADAPVALRLALAAWSAWSALSDGDLACAAGHLAPALVAEAERGEPDPACRRQIAIHHNVEAMLRLRLDRPAEALPHIEACLRENEALGDLFGMATALNNLAEVRRVLGDAAGARRALERAIDLADGPLRHPQNAAIFLSNLARSHIDAGDAAAASAALAAAAAREREHPLPALRAELLVREAAVWALRPGDAAAERARSLAERGVVAASSGRVDEDDRRGILEEARAVIQRLVDA